jgi:hypothetical protein
MPAGRCVAAAARKVGSKNSPRCLHFPHVKKRFSAQLIGQGKAIPSTSVACGTAHGCFQEWVQPPGEENETCTARRVSVQNVGQLSEHASRSIDSAQSWQAGIRKLRIIARNKFSFAHSERQTRGKFRFGPTSTIIIAYYRYFPGDFKDYNRGQRNCTPIQVPLGEVTLALRTRHIIFDRPMCPPKRFRRFVAHLANI